MAVSPQGSRAGLITALVIFVLTTCIAGGFAFHYNSELNKLVKSAEANEKRLQTLISSAQADSARFREIDEARRATNQTIFGELNQQLDAVTQLVAGKAEATDRVLADAKNRRDAVNVRLSRLQIPTLGDSLVSNLETLATALEGKEQVIATANSEIAKLKKTLAENQEAVKTSADAARGEVATIARQRDTVQTETKAQIEKNTALIAQAQSETVKAFETKGEELQRLTLELQSAQRDAQAAKMEVNRLQNRLRLTMDVNALMHFKRLSKSSPKFFM